MTALPNAAMTRDECPCDRDKTVDPLCCAAGMCVREADDPDAPETPADGARRWMDEAAT